MATCVVSGTLLNPSEVAISGATVRYNIQTPCLTTSALSLLGPSEVTTTTNGSGVWSLTLSQGSNGILSIDIPPDSVNGTQRYDFTIAVPATATATFPAIWVDLNPQANVSPPNQLADGTIWIGNPANQPIATTISGDATLSDIGVLTVSANAVTNAKLAQMATLTIKGNSTGGTANASDLSVATVQSMLSISGVNTGDVTLTAVGSTPSANGASLSGQALTLQPADSTHPGLLSATTQSLGGNKTFTGTVSASNLSGTNTGDQTITLTGDVTGSGTGSFAATVASNAVTNSKLAQAAANTLKGNNTGSTANVIDMTVAQAKTLLGVGAANGIAPLDGGSKVPAANLPSTLMNYQGAWNAGTNSPTLADGTGTNGDVYRASTAGTQNLGSGAQTWAAGDFAIYNGSIWQHSPAADGVSSVNGATGAVTVNAINQLTADVTAGPASGSASAAATVAKIQGTTVSGTTGSTNVVFSNSPTLVTPALGTPSALVGTNITGTAASLTAGTVTTNANLTGDVTSVGNATTYAGTVPLNKGGTGQTTKAAAFDALQPMTTGGDLIYGGASGTGTRLANGTSGQLLQSNGGTTAPTWVVAPKSGGGSKNYLTTYIASTSSNTANPGNGDFEGNTTTGWSLAHSALTSLIPTSVASAGTAFDSTHGGSAAAGALTFAAVSSGALTGVYSGDLSQNAASTAGDLLISSAFFIDTEDQAKILSFKFAYNANTNPTNMNFSGTSANSFAVYIYDVTNGAWIQPAGVYNLVQSSGVGISTGTFQTTSTSTKYQFAIVNINATAGAFALYIDDISVGPQTAAMGPAMTDLIAYTPIFTGFGTVSTTSISYSRRGDKLVISGDFTPGTTSGTTASVSIPSGLTIDSTKLSGSSNQLIGIAVVNSVSAGESWTVLAAPINNTATAIYFSALAYTGTNALSPQSGNTLGPAGGVISLYAEMPIIGWSSNTAMSADTDTRVAAARLTNGAGTSITKTANNTIPFPTTDFDTHGSFLTDTYTIPVSGIYQLNVHYTFASATWATGDLIETDILKNGSTWGSKTDYIEGSFTSAISTGYSEILKFSAGDTVKVQTFPQKAAAGNLTLVAVAATNTFTINRLSGPAVVTATEDVNARYYASSTTISGSLATISWTTKDYDSHGVMAAGTYTVPVSGKYQVNSAILVTGTIALNNNLIMEIQKNGSVTSRETVYFPATLTDGTAQLSDIISCAAGDTLRIQVSTNVTAPSIVSSNFDNYISLSRVGN